MPQLFVTTREGEKHILETDRNISLMEVIRDGGFDELLAVCGGCCSCATCHIYVDPTFSDALPAASDDENDLLDGTEHRKEISRLACQIKFTEALNGLQVRIAPEG